MLNKTKLVEELILKNLKELGITNKDILDEAVRLGPVFMDKDYEKLYRFMTMDQFILAHKFYLTIKEEDFDRYFVGLEKVVGKPKIDSIHNKDEMNAWDRELVETPEYYEIVDYCKDNNINTEINTGLCYYVTCIIEAACYE